MEDNIPSSILHDVRRLSDKQTYISSKPNVRPTGFTKHGPGQAAMDLEAIRSSVASSTPPSPQKQVRQEGAPNRILTRIPTYKSTKPDNAFMHSKTARRVSHLMDPNPLDRGSEEEGETLAFVYENQYNPEAEDEESAFQQAETTDLMKHLRLVTIPTVSFTKAYFFQSIPINGLLNFLVCNT